MTIRWINQVFFLVGRCQQYLNKLKLNLVYAPMVIQFSSQRLTVPMSHIHHVRVSNECYELCTICSSPLPISLFHSILDSDWYRHSSCENWVNRIVWPNAPSFWTFFFCIGFAWTVLTKAHHDIMMMMMMARCGKLRVTTMYYCTPLLATLT